MRLLLHRGGGTLRRQLLQAKAIAQTRAWSVGWSLFGGLVWVLGMKVDCRSQGHQEQGTVSQGGWCVFWIRVNGETFEVISHGKALGHDSSPQREAYRLSATLESWAMVRTLCFL